MSTPPKWFKNQNLHHTKSQIIGYGQSKEYSEALQIAKTQISKMLQTNIDSTVIIDKSSSANDYEKNVSERIKETSSVRLNALEIIKKERIGNMWFVAIVYDNLPLFLKITNSTHPKNENFNHPYLSKTKLFKSLKGHFGFYPKANIYTQNGQYYIAIDNQQFLISQQEFMELFIINTTHNISIELKDSLRDGEAYFITTKFREFGFASLFLVASSGTVVTMFKNIELVDASFTYPNKKEYDGLRAKIEGNIKQSKEMYIALLCQQKEDLGLFNQVTTKLEKDSFRFGDLVDLMERCAFSTKVFTIFR
jgi:hypothetical protein